MKTALELLQEFGLNWEITKEPLSFSSPVNNELLIETPFYGAVRSDNYDCLGTFTDRYEAFQNEEMLELALRVSEHTGYNVEKGTNYNGGKQVMVKLAGGHEILEYPQVGDIIEKKIEFRNSHDGSGSLQIAMGTVVLSCTNGMTRFVKGKQTKIRHAANMRDMVESALVGLDMIVQQYDTMMDEIKRMIETPITPDNVNEMFMEVMNVDLNKVASNYTSEEYSTKTLNKAKTLKDSIAEEIAYKGSNAWGLLSGVTHFTTHKAGADHRRETAKAVGSLLSIDNKAYDYALSLV